MREIIVFGAGGHAKVVIDALERVGTHRNIILVDDRPELHGQNFFGYPVIGGRFALLERNTTSMEAIVAIGHNTARLEVSIWLQNNGFALTKVIHPTACIGRGCVIGPCSFLAAGAVLNSASSIGEAVIINTGATVDHDCVLGSAVHVAPGCHLCGNVTVGQCTLIGAGSVIVPGVRIGANVVVGAGSVVLEDIADGLRVAGVPARPIG